jgi:hypothetical protein
MNIRTNDLLAEDILLLVWQMFSANPALQVGRVSDETVKYGCEFCGTWTQV